MSDQNQNTDHETRDLRNALEEVAGASDMLAGSLAAEGEVQLSEAAVAEVSESQIEALRTRARRERQRGVKNLERRHDGVASVLRRVVLNERVIASAFERWFAGVENGIYVLSKRGHMFVSEKNADQLIEQVTEMISEMEKAVASQLAGAETHLGMLDAGDILDPVYSSPATDREVQLRSPLSTRVLKIVQAQDQVLCALMKLHWNGEIEKAVIEEQENNAKKGLRDLAKFLSRTLRAMRGKVEAKASSAATPAAASTQEQVQEAA
jgi:hypothetical protein